MLGLVALCASTAQAAPSKVAPRDASTGRIVFTSNRDGNNEIYIMDGDGANLQRLTNLPGNDHSPCLSPDGRKLLWASSRQAGAGADIYEMNIDGTNERQLTSNGADEIHPSYSPDGTKVAYSRYGINDYDIWIFDLKNMTERRLTSNSLGDYNPAWSPDGSKIAFKTFYGQNYTPQVTVINSSGTGQAQLTTEGGNEYPSWNKDGYIAFWSNRGGQLNIYAMNADGSNQQPLTTSAANRDPAWNPAGTKIAFARNTGADYEIYSLDINGDPPVRLTTNSAQDDTPFWGRAPLPDSGRTLSIEDTEVVEGDSGSVVARFKVSLSAAATVPVSVTYGVASGTANIGFDVARVSGTVFFAAGETEQFIDIPVLGDTSTEGDETFRVNLTNPLGATITDSQGIGTIIDNESFPVIRLNTASVPEGDAGTADAVLTATLSVASTRTVTVAYATEDGSAKAGSDYIAQSGTLTFAPGQTSQQITVKVNGNTRYEPDEFLTVKLSNPVWGRLDPPATFPQIFNPDNGHWYRFVQQPRTWDNAVNDSVAMNVYGVGGHLVTVNSLAEQNFLVTHFGNRQYLMGGYQSLNSVEPGGGWRWVTDEPFDYTNWNTGEPNNASAGQNEDIIYAYASTSPYPAGSWNDAPRNTYDAFLVEFDTPASAGLYDRPGTIVINNDDPGPLPASVFTLDFPNTYHLTSLSKVEGTVQDYANGGGITRVYFLLARQSDNYYWNGASWGALETPLSAEISGDGPLQTWKRTFGLPTPGPDPLTQLQNGGYSISAIAVNADNQKAHVNRVYVFDGTAPTVVVDSPTDGTAIK